MKDDLNLIDRQALIDALVKICDRECEYSEQQRSVMCNACPLGSTFDAMLQLPSVQPEIIRRKDCKHYNAGFKCLIEGYGIKRDKQ